MRRWLYAGLPLALLAIAAMYDLSRLGADLPWRHMYDFPDFYCAGSAVLDGRSPYTYEPLHTCEHSVAASALLRADPALVIPAPQPPYDFPPFALLAKLGFPAARAIDGVAIVVAMLLCAVALARVVPFDLALLAVALPAGYLELNAGQVFPFALLALCLCGAALASRRDGLAGVFAGLTAIEPHLGLPITLATILFVPRARWGVAGIAALLAVTGISVVGLRGFIGYFARTIPAHAASEAAFPYQYSLTYAASSLGMSPRGALVLGVLSFLALLVAGLALAPRIAATMRCRALLVFFPAACAVMAGPFIHIVEIPAAIPSALVFATRSRGNAKTLAAAALCALAVPWIRVWSINKLFFASLFVSAALLLRLEIAAPVILAMLAGIAGTMLAFELRPPHLPHPVSTHAALGANDLAQRGYASFAQSLRTAGPAWLAIKFPTWFALASLLAVALRARNRPDEDRELARTMAKWV